MTNDQRYLVYETFFAMEDGHSKKLKARHNKKLKNNEKRFYDSMGFKQSETSSSGEKIGYSKRGDGQKVRMKVSNDNKYDPAYEYEPASKDTGDILISRKVARMKGSDLVGAHEYSHAMTDAKRKNNIILRRSKTGRKILDEQISKEDGFDKLSKDAIRKNKIKNKHDKNPDEMRADHYAITTTKGENNSNRLRKNMNELSRRNAQSRHDKRKAMLNELDTILDSDDGEKYNPKIMVGKKISKFASKATDKLYKDALNSSKKDHAKRQKTNDYIVSKKKEK